MLAENASMGKEILPPWFFLVIAGCALESEISDGIALGNIYLSLLSRQIKTKMVGRGGRGRGRRRSIRAWRYSRKPANVGTIATKQVKTRAYAHTMPWAIPRNAIKPSRRQARRLCHLSKKQKQKVVIRNTYNNKNNPGVRRNCYDGYNKAFLHRPPTPPTPAPLPQQKKSLAVTSRRHRGEAIMLARATTTRCIDATTLRSALASLTPTAARARSSHNSPACPCASVSEAARPEIPAPAPRR